MLCRRNSSSRSIAGEGVVAPAAAAAAAADYCVTHTPTYPPTHTPHPHTRTPQRISQSMVSQAMLVPCADTIICEVCYGLLRHALHYSTFLLVRTAKKHRHLLALPDQCRTSTRSTSACKRRSTSIASGSSSSSSTGRVVAVVAVVVVI